MPRNKPTGRLTTKLDVRKQSMKPPTGSKTKAANPPANKPRKPVPAKWTASTPGDSLPTHASRSSGQKRSDNSGCTADLQAEMALLRQEVAALKQKTGESENAQEA